MNYNEKYELDRALEALMDIIEKCNNLTDEQWNTLGAIYDNVESWDDYWKLNDLFNKYRG